MKNQPPLRAPFGRLRYDGSITRVPGTSTNATFFGTAPDTYTYSTYAVNSGYSGTHRLCIDTVTPGFHRLKDTGAVINNAFSSFSETCECSGTGNILDYVASTSPWPASRVKQSVNSCWKLNSDPSFLYPPLVTSNGDFIPPTSLVDVDYLRRASKTMALSRVDQSKAQLAVGLAELRQTLQMLANPLSDILSYTKRFKFHPYGKYNFRTKKLDHFGVDKSPGGLPAAIANQYLQYYYGILPFLRDIENYIDAYVTEGLETPRQTARGSATDSHVQTSYSYGDRSTVGVSLCDIKYTRTDEVSVRSGNLYIPTPNTFQKTFGLRAGDFFGTVYQATPWTFFLDYFSNLGTLIEALSPRYGISYLASWNTVKTKIIWESEVIDSWILGQYTHSRKSTEKAVRIYESTVRVPDSPYANVGLTLKNGDWSSQAKCAAVLSLAIQQFAKKFKILSF